MNPKKYKNLIQDLALIFLSILVTIILVKTGAIKDLTTSLKDFTALASLISGMFFVSVFTVAPTSVTLIELAKTSSPLLVAFFGGIGALLGDLLIFRFFRDSLSINLLDKLMGAKETWLTRLVKSKTFKLIGPLVGALIIISPFPDEIGLAMMGFCKVKTKTFIPLSFALNFIGILGIIYFLK